MLTINSVRSRLPTGAPPNIATPCYWTHSQVLVVRIITTMMIISTRKNITTYHPHHHTTSLFYWTDTSRFFHWDSMVIETQIEGDRLSKGSSYWWKSWGTPSYSWLEMSMMMTRPSSLWRKTPLPRSTPTPEYVISCFSRSLWAPNQSMFWSIWFFNLQTRLFVKQGLGEPRWDSRFKMLRSFDR